MIVLLHGFAAHRFLMRRLEKSFRAANQNTLNWGYRSLFRPIEFHGQRLANVLRQLDDDESVTTIDFVTHSMGSIVTRAALSIHRPQKCGRWVMLAPPNNGSFVADRIPRIVRRVLPPLQELMTDDDSYVNQLPVPTGVDIAVIQALGDFVVNENNTRIEQEKDRFVVPGLHSAMLLRDDVSQQSLYFLEHGHFQNQHS